MKLEVNRRYFDLFKEQGRRAFFLDDNLWVYYQNMIVPVGPAIDNFSLSRTAAKFLLHKLSPAILVRSTTGFSEIANGWYSVICDNVEHIMKMRGKIRKEIVRGANKCEVRKVSVKFIAENAWPVFSSAFKRYRNTRLVKTERQFKQNMLAAIGFEDIVDCWGVFEKESGRLIAYSQVYLYDKIEANYSMTKFDPDYLRLNPSAILFYERNKYYLDVQKFQYVNSGFRNLSHATRVQEVLISKFGFRKQSMGLQIHYHPVTAGIICATYPCRNLLQKSFEFLRPLYKLEEINRRTCSQ